MSVKWGGAQPPSLYVEHGAEQRELPMAAAGGGEAPDAAVEVPYVEGRTIDLMVRGASLGALQRES